MKNQTYNEDEVLQQYLAGLVHYLSTDIERRLLSLGKRPVNGTLGARAILEAYRTMKPLGASHEA